MLKSKPQYPNNHDSLGRSSVCSLPSTDTVAVCTNRLTLNYFLYESIYTFAPQIAANLKGLLPVNVVKLHHVIRKSSPTVSTRNGLGLTDNSSPALIQPLSLST